MPGIRIRHREVTNRRLTIVDKQRPYTKPLLCPACGITHVFKTYHIDLDDVGAAIVSIEVWEKVQQIPAHGFQIENVVMDPPKQTIGMGIHPKGLPRG